MKGEGIIRSKRETFPTLSQTDTRVGPGKYINVKELVQKQQSPSKIQSSPGFMSGEGRFTGLQNPHAGFPGPGKYDNTHSKSSKCALFYSKAPREVSLKTNDIGISTPGPGAYNLTGGSTKGIKRRKHRIPLANPSIKFTGNSPLNEKVKVGPGSYNPDVKAVKSKARSLIVYHPPKKQGKTVVDKIYQYVSEIKAMNQHQAEPSAKDGFDSFLKKSNVPCWHKPVKKYDISEDSSSPGPGTYNAISTSFLGNRNKSNCKRGTFGTQKRSEVILDKDNKLLIKTDSNYDSIPGVGEYLKPSFFKWKAGPYPSSAFCSSNNRSYTGIAQIENIPGPGEYNIPSREQPHFLHKIQPFGSKCPRFKENKTEQPLLNELEQFLPAPPKPKERRWMSHRPRFEKTVVLSPGPSKDLDLTINPILTESRTDPPPQQQKYKEIIQNALNLVNGIAFNSHKTKCEGRIVVKPSITPGPGYYDLAINSPRKLQGVSPTAPKEERLKWNPAETEDVGPGAYYKDTTWIRGSYNVTLPNNVIHKRKEEIIQARLEQSKEK